MGPDMRVRWVPFPIISITRFYYMCAWDVYIHYWCATHIVRADWQDFADERWLIDICFGARHSSRAWHVAHPSWRVVRMVVARFPADGLPSIDMWRAKQKSINKTASIIGCIYQIDSTIWFLH